MNDPIDAEFVESPRFPGLPEMEKITWRTFCLSTVDTKELAVFMKDPAFRQQLMSEYGIRVATYVELKQAHEAVLANKHATFLNEKQEFVAMMNKVSEERDRFKQLYVESINEINRLNVTSDVAAKAIAESLRDAHEACRPNVKQMKALRSILLRMGWNIDSNGNLQHTGQSNSVTEK